MIEAVLARLRALPFFSALKEDTLCAIAEAGHWYSAPGGAILFEEGARASALYFILAGRLVVVRRGEEGEEVIGYIRAGEPVGEMSLMTGEKRSSSVYALRDSEILAVDRSAFSRLLSRYADLAVQLARFGLMRARRAKVLSERSAPRIFALIAASPSVDATAYASRLCDEAAALGRNATFMREDEAPPDSAIFDRIENDHDVVFLPARVGDTPWYRFVLRHSDRLMVLARRDARPPRPFPMTTEAGARARKFRLVDLVVVHEGAQSCQTTDWMEATAAQRVFHLRGDGCWRRLARIIAGRSVGLVLSGGGARAYAHIGAIRALREAGVEIDLVGGASMGAIIAACLAMGWDQDEMEARIREAFVASNPLSDYVLPVVAMTRGARVDERLQRHFGDALIEDLPAPFYCVSSELTEGRLFVHGRGLLRDALRASISLPGVLPPVVSDGALLVDGAVINNFPTEIMGQRHRGLTIGVDVARRGTISADAFTEPPGFFSWVRRNGLGSAPPIVSLLMRSATARHDQNAAPNDVDVLVTPGVAGVQLRDWKRYDAAVEDGYLAMRKALDGAPDLVRPAV